MGATMTSRTTIATMVNDGHAIEVEADELVGVHLHVEDFRAALMTIEPEDARTLAALLVRGADEVERLRALNVPAPAPVTHAITIQVDPHDPAALSKLERIIERHIRENPKQGA